MELKKGYKMTEVGVIPEDWVIKAIESLTPQNKKYGIVDGPFGSNLKTEHYRKVGIPIITSGYVTEGVFNAQDYLYVDIEKFNQEKRSAVRGGDIVMAKIGARCGASAILPVGHPIGILSGNALKITVNEEAYSSYFVWQILWNFYLTNDIEILRTTGAQPAISMANLKKYNIPIPSSKGEQTAIATTLSDADALITALEKLINKKRLIKQGVMQQLLTGKKRLPGFSGEWEVCPLSEVADRSIKWSITGGPFGSNLKATDYTIQGVQIIQLQNIGDGVFYDDYAIYTSETKADELLSCNIYPGDIILSKMGDPVARACFIPNTAPRFLMASDGIRLVVNKNEFSERFVHDYINSIYFRKRAFEVSNGSTRLRIGLPELKKLMVIKPPLEEQTAIAQILSDIDTEIENLEKKLAKYRLLKQGMMQNLLTGKIRLV